jgi:hypothetical protein
MEVHANRSQNLSAECSRKNAQFETQSLPDEVETSHLLLVTIRLLDFALATRERANLVIG